MSSFTSTSSKQPHLRLLLSESEIQRRIRELADELEREEAAGEALYLVGILKGSLFFLVDLARQLQRRVRIDFIGISSYGNSMTSSGEVRLTKDLDLRIEGRDVLIVEDIVDTGLTLNYLLQVLQQRKPRRLRVATLLDKPSRRTIPVQLDFVGFTIPNVFVVGYGLDYAEEYRNLRAIYVLEGVGETA